MKDPELDILIAELEGRTDLTIADFDAVHHALVFLLPDRIDPKAAEPLHISTTDGAMTIADAAYPNWVVHIHGRANDKDGQWRCHLREHETRDTDSAIGSGRSPVLAQAILAAVLRLSMILSKRPDTA